MITGKRLKNEFYFSSRCYTILPLGKSRKYLYTFVFGIIDINAVMLLMVTVGTILLVTDWGIILKILFLFIFLLSEIVYLIYMMLVIEIMTEKYGNSKNLFMLTFMPFMFLEMITRIAEKFYLFDYYPIAGWIGSTVIAINEGDVIQALIYIVVTILLALLGLYLLDKMSFPKKTNVF
jgi:hypothetical protein